jgi:hypothetical protein
MRKTSILLGKFEEGGFILLLPGNLLRPDAVSRNLTQYLTNMCTHGVYITGVTAPGIVQEVTSGRHLQNSWAGGRDFETTC